MSYDTVLYETAEGVCTVTLNRPEVRNALSFHLIEELNDAVKAYQAAQAATAKPSAGATPSAAPGPTPPAGAG